MLISSQSLIPIIVTLAAAAVGLCYLPIVSDVVSAITERQRKRRSARQSAKQLEQKVLASHWKTLDKIETQAKTDIKTTLEKIEGTLTGRLTAFSEKNRQKLETTTGKYLDETNIALKGLVESAAKRIDDELTKQLESARTELENYKEKQIRKIDEEVATLVEKTIYKTLGKGLSREDHIDIIYESLAEAKEEGFFKTNAK